MKNRFRALFVLLLAAILVAGCGLAGLGKPSVVSLTRDAMNNMKKVGSAEVRVRTDGDISAVYDALNIGANVTLDSDSVIEMTKDPGRAKGTTDLTVGAVGQEQTIHGQFYRDKTESASTTYVRWENGDWMKKTKKAGQAEQTEETEGKKEGKNQGIVIPDSIMQAAGILKYISDGSLKAELLEETVQVNEKEAYQINCVLSGQLLKELIENGTINVGDIDLSAAKIDWEKVSVPAGLYIYKESKLPARITLDCTSIGSQIVGNLLKDELEQIPFGEIRLDVSKFLVDITVDRYDEIEAIEIPAEAEGAVESDNMFPSLTDFFQF